MEQDKNILTSYAFLASISENKSDLFSEVYIPLIKRVLCHYVGKSNYGKDEDLQKEVLDNYSIKIPLSVLRQILKAINKDLSKTQRENYGLELYENGKSFQVQEFPFNKLEEFYLKSRRYANSIESEFDNFLKKTQDENGQYKFSDFIEYNKNKLTSFFLNNPKVSHESFESTFYPHIEFLQEIESENHELFQTAKQIFLGSIIASYIESEINLEAKFEEKTVYYLDTRIVLEALDLQNESDTKPTKELLRLIKSSNGIIRILNITIKEIYDILEQEVSQYDKNNPVTTINEACLRNGTKRTDLIYIKDNLDNYLKKYLGVEIDEIQQPKIKKYKKFNDIKELEELRNNKSKNSEHDVFAYLFVRDQRGEKLYTPQKSKYWFLSSNKSLLSFNMRKQVSGTVPEIIMPDALTSLLWLKNPKKFSGEVADTGLKEVIAETISKEYVDKELLSEFEENLERYADISDEEYESLHTALAHESAHKIRQINEYAEQKDESQFKNEVGKILHKERDRKRREKEEKEKLEANKENLENESKKLENNNQRKDEELAKKDEMITYLSNKNKYKDNEIENLENKEQENREKIEEVQQNIKNINLDRSRLVKFNVFLLALFLIIVTVISVSYFWSFKSFLSYLYAILSSSFFWGALGWGYHFYRKK